MQKAGSLFIGGRQIKYWRIAKLGGNNAVPKKNPPWEMDPVDKIKDYFKGRIKFKSLQAIQVLFNHDSTKEQIARSIMFLYEHASGESKKMLVSEKSGNSIQTANFKLGIEITPPATKDDRSPGAEKYLSKDISFRSNDSEKTEEKKQEKSVQNPWDNKNPLTNEEKIPLRDTLFHDEILKDLCIPLKNYDKWCAESDEQAGSMP